MRPLVLALALFCAACGPAAQAPVGETAVNAPATAPADPADPAAQTPAPEGLTPAAAETWRRIKVAADAGDAATLVAIAAETPGFAYTFGPEEDFAAYIEIERAAGRDPVAALAAILALPPGQTTLDGARLFHWPYFYDWEAARYTPEARADAARIVGEAAAAQITTELGYLGPRTGIDESGAWLFYVKGD